VPGPFFTSALLAAPLLIEGGSDQQKKELLPRMAKGEFIGTVAIAEAAGRFDAEESSSRRPRAQRIYSYGEKFSCPMRTWPTEWRSRFAPAAAAKRELLS